MNNKQSNGQRVSILQLPIGQYTFELERLYDQGMIPRGDQIGIQSELLFEKFPAVPFRNDVTIVGNQTESWTKQVNNNITYDNYIFFKGQRR